MIAGTAPLSSGILGDDNMFDPTQTQPLSWRMHQGKPTPWEEVPIDPPNRQEPSFDAPPDRLAERGYRLRARIGHCRLGTVYEAQDELSRISGSKHFAAVTLIDPRISARPGFAADFEPGAGQLQSIAHPNIVKLLEYGCERGHHYLVNELLESASLRFVLNDVGALPAGEAVAVLRPVGDALQYLHAKGIVHGDLRPESVLVTFGYQVKLLDIVPAGWLVSPTDALGVPARGPDKRDDVFGLACLAYEMLAGRHPYNGNTAQEAYRAGLEPARIDDLPDRQWRALANALAVHRDDRTPNVAQFLDEFGVSPAEQLRTVVAATNDVREAGVAQAAAQLAGEVPATAPRVVAMRAKSAAPAHSSGLRTLFLLFALIGLGAAAWYYRDPLVTFGSELIATVETEVGRIRAADPRPAAPAADAPLTQAPVVIDDTPATVVADATGQNVVKETAGPAMPEADARAAVATGALPAAEPLPAPSEPARGATSATAESSADAAGPVRFAFDREALAVREGDVAARVVIRRSGDSSGTTEISWWTAEGTAVADRDYADLGARIERFAPGESSRTIYVPLTNDVVPEPARSFRVLLDGGAEIRVDILDDD